MRALAAHVALKRREARERGDLIVTPPLASLATTYSPASWDAVPSALRVFTAEFGMGSGVHPSPQPPGRRRPRGVWVGVVCVLGKEACVVRGLAAARNGWKRERSSSIERLGPLG